MPYIKQQQRDVLRTTSGNPHSAGELNFKITELAIGYLYRCGLNYQSINDIMGALEGAKQEFYRRVAIPYENGKIQDNGDVYPDRFLSDKFPEERTK